MTGVRHVSNMIAVRHDTGPADIAWRIQQALDRYALVPEDTVIDKLQITG